METVAVEPWRCARVAAAVDVVVAPTTLGLALPTTPPHTCNRVRTKSRGAQAMELTVPLHIPDIKLLIQ
jgi:hypothetical protein